MGLPWFINKDEHFFYLFRWSGEEAGGGERGADSRLSGRKHKVSLSSHSADRSGQPDALTEINQSDITPRPPPSPPPRPSYFSSFPPSLKGTLPLRMKTFLLFYPSQLPVFPGCFPADYQCNTSNKTHQPSPSPLFPHPLTLRLLHLPAERRVRGEGVKFDKQFVKKKKKSKRKKMNVRDNVGWGGVWLQ